MAGGNDKQCIMVYCNRVNGLDNTLVAAIYLAVFLRKKICLLATYRNRVEKEELNTRLQRLQARFSEQLKLVGYNSLLLKGKLKDWSADLSDRYESVLFCLSGNMDNQLLAAFYKSRTPYFFVRGADVVLNKFARLNIPVDFRESSKDAALWGSYFGRLNSAQVMLLRANDSDRDLEQKVTSNLESILNLYRKFSFPFIVEKSLASSWKIHGEAIKNSLPSDLFVFSGSFNVSMPDYIFGPFEKRMINRNPDISILLINPRHEMCVICD